MVNYTYNAWGEIISTTGTLASTIGAVNKLRYRSYYYDDETGFYYLQSRYYDPIVKRFISPDSTDYLTENGTFDGFNLYAYCVNNPVIYQDCFGYGIFKTLREKVLGLLGIITSSKATKMRKAHSQNVVNIGSGKSYTLSSSFTYSNKDNYISRCEDIYDELSIYMDTFHNISLSGKKWSDLTSSQKNKIISKMPVWDRSFYYKSAAGEALEKIEDAFDIIYK